MSKITEMLLARKREVQDEIAKLTASLGAELSQIDVALAAIEGKPSKRPRQRKRLKKHKRTKHTIGGKTLEIINMHPNGLQTREITEKFNAKHNETLLTRNMSWHLSKLKREQEVVLEGDLWKPKAPEDEAPGSSEPSAPSHHGNGNGTLLSSGSEEAHTSLAALPGAIPAVPGAVSPREKGGYLDYPYEPRGGL